MQLRSRAEKPQKERHDVTADRDLNGEENAGQELIAIAGIAIGHQRPQGRLWIHASPTLPYPEPGDPSIRAARSPACDSSTPKTKRRPDFRPGGVRSTCNQS